MKINKNFIKSGVYTTKRALKKYSPEILMGIGIAGGIIAAVKACNATLKINDINIKSKEIIEEVHEKKDEDGYKKELTIAYAKVGFSYFKLYGPSVLLGAASIGCIFASHGIMVKRNMILASAYSTLDDCFERYRAKVRDTIGEDKERELAYGVEEETTTTTNDKGKKIKEKVKVITGIKTSPYAVEFNNKNVCWDTGDTYNEFFLRTIEDIVNRKLKDKHHVFLNEVYDELHVDRTGLGHVAGWVYDPSIPSDTKQIIFSINQYKRRNINNPDILETVFVVDFNPKSNIEGIVFGKQEDTKCLQ